MSAVVLLSPARSRRATGEAACITAEVNPVTGHVLCIEPLGAAVEPPRPRRPESGRNVRGQWIYSPNCTPEVEGM